MGLLQDWYRKRQIETNPHLKDEVYRIVGEEMARRELHPGPMARAVQEAQGRSELIDSLYVKFRHEELLRHFERAAAEQDARTTNDEQMRQIKPSLVACPNCGHHGEPLVKERGNGALCVLLFLLGIVPGIIYAIDRRGYMGVCGNCGQMVVERI